MSLAIQDKLSCLPKKPGIYYMKDRYDNIIYIGKSKNLHQRVRQYFTKSANHSDKILEMIDRICDFYVKVTDTEFEALLLENKEIKNHLPLYNRQMKKFKGYPYIKIIRDKHPKIVMAMNRNEDEGIYFGPYSSKGRVEEAIDFIKMHFGLRLCNRSRVQKGGCLNHQLGKCDGLCKSEIDPKMYDGKIEEVVAFLDGKNKTPVKELQQLMEIESEKMNFESAAKYKSMLVSVNHILSHTETKRFNTKNLVVLARVNSEIDGGKYKVFYIKSKEVLATVLTNLCETYFPLNELTELAFEHFGSTKSKIEIMKEELDDAKIIHSYLNGENSDVYFVNIPQSHIVSRNVVKVTEAISKLLKRAQNNTP